MLDTILNNPHYIMYAMIAAFVIVVVALIIVASTNVRKPSSYEPTPRSPTKPKVNSSEKSGKHGND